MDPLFAASFLLFFLVIFLSFYLLNKIQIISSLKKNITYLNQSIQELDNQAKLIIKSDVELKLYQEETEDKLNKLTFLKNLLLSSLYILDREDLFFQINEKIINDIGFRKGLIVDFNSLEIKVNIGFSPQEEGIIKKFLKKKKEDIAGSSFISGYSPLCKELASSLGSEEILIAPIKGRKERYALFFLYELLHLSEIDRSQQEILSIICIYLGQCLENIKLFEELYRSKDELEKKVREKTFELTQTLKEVEEANKLKSDFISSVSHELRTPLTSVKGFSSLLVEEKFGKLPQEAKKRLERIDENVDKLVNMVNTLLDISRIESGKMEIKIAPSDIAKLINEVGDFLSPQIHEKNINLILDMPGSVIVYMDKNLIERVLINLINNAIKFTPPRGEIKVRCERENGLAKISVSDTGCGIEKENLEKVFKEFFRVNNPINKEVRGSGLGLSLVKRIIDTHKQKIWVDSEPGKGTTFFFTLELAD